jgi:hypothetical protein
MEAARSPVHRWWGQQVIPKRRCLYTKLYGVASQETAVLNCLCLLWPYSAERCHME